MPKAYSSLLDCDQFIQKAHRVLDESIAKLRSLRIESSALFFQSLTLFKKTSEYISQLPFDTTNSLGEHANACRTTLNELTVLMQFEDVFNQKIDHLEKIYRFQSEELVTQLKANTSEKHLEFNLITEVNIAQLDYIHSEYEEVLTNIKSKLAELLHLLAESSNISSKNQIIPSTENTRGKVEDLETTINKYLVSCQSYLFAQKLTDLRNTYQELLITPSLKRRHPYQESAKLKEIFALYTMESERFIYNRIMRKYAGKQLITAQENSSDSSGSVDLF